MPSANIIVCHECDLVLRETALEEGGVACCSRCGHELYRNQPKGLERSLSCALAAVVFFILANAFPIVSMEAHGLSNSATLLGTVSLLDKGEMSSVALLLFVTAFLMPALQIIALIYLLLPLYLGKVAVGTPAVFRLLYSVKPWGMVEVFMLGILITVSKLMHMASVVPGVALWSFGLLMVLIAAASSGFDKHVFWARVEALQ